ncbi:MAG: exodeoxyribonuclease V subunit beta [Desulfuromonadaceae bacterium]|nr:exodeoxyribonuclease V subunit beta [Desulfuromonadaceae bacterium]
MITFDSLKIETSATNLIEASAGTGKTYAIASLYVRLVVENEHYKPENILVVTFTEAATMELRDRIRMRLREARDVAAGSPASDKFLLNLMSAAHEGWPGSDLALSRLDKALQSFDCAAISTIHGFCSRALQENAFESGSLFDTELVKNQKPLFNQIVDDFWRINFFKESAPLLPLAEVKKWSPETFSKFLNGKLTNSVLKIVPEFTPTEITNIWSSCTASYKALCKMWSTDNLEIENILLTHTGLSRNQKFYKIEKIPELIEGMDLFVKNGTPFALFEGHLKLTAEFMHREGIRLKKVAPPEHKFFTLWDELLASVNKMALTVYCDLLEFAKERLKKLKSARNIRLYVDLLADLYSALNGSGGRELAERMRAKYRAAVVDEFQDTDQIQYKIFCNVFKDGEIPLFLVGDPKQAIYSFRGADIYAYLEAREGVPDGKRHTMVLNWRSSGKLVEAVNTLFSLNKTHPLLIDGLSYPDVKSAEVAEDQKKELTLEERNPAPMQIWFFTREPSEKKCIPVKRGYPAVVNAVTSEISALLKDASEGKAVIGGKSDSKALVPGDIAVIVRGHKQGKMIYDSLQLRGIPSVIRSEQSVFQTPEAAELRIILNALADYWSEGKVRASLATCIMGVSASEIARSFEPDGEADWERRLNSYREYHELWKNYGFITMFRTFLEAEDIRARLLKIPGGERSITNLLHCGELLHTESSSSHHGVDALCTWFNEQVATHPDSEEHQIRLESDERAVKILTIHVSKGLEFPVVFCPFLSGGVIDSAETVLAHDGYDIVADFGSDDFDRHHRAAMDEALAENLRLLYVALTRAKYRCYVAWGRFRYAESSALAYLFHAPPVTAEFSPYQELVKVMEDVSDSSMIKKITAVQSEGGINLVVDPPDDLYHSYNNIVGTDSQLNCRFNERVIESEWRVTSFSSLIDGHISPPEYPDHDSSDETAQLTVENIKGESSIFDFPKGAEPGTFLHSLFEKLDFAKDNEESRRVVVSSMLESSVYGTGYTDMVCKMLTAVCEAELSAGLTLSSLQPGNWVQEMEFYFPLNLIDPRALGDLFRSFRIEKPVNLQHIAESLNFQSVKGMLLGFIDLVFCHSGKYYIIDWKSNYLGNKAEKYSTDNLAIEMKQKLYSLQYLIYTVALNRYLERRISDYDYETHFGGAYYIFLRGVDNSIPGNGIYFDKPDAAMVRELTKLMIDFEVA